MLTIEEVKRNPKLVDGFVEQHKKLVHSTVNKYFPYAREDSDYEDIIQIAHIGLFKAIKNFDVKSGNQFSTYAVPKIMSEVKNHYRSDSKGCLNTTNEMRIQWRRYLYLSTSKGYTDEEITRKMDITLQDINELKRSMQSVKSFNDIKVESKSEEQHGIEDLIALEYNLEDECMYDLEYKYKVNMIRSLMPNKYMQAFKLRLKGMNQANMAKELKCTNIICGKIIDRLMRVIEECINPYYNKEITMQELRKRLRNILQIEADIKLGGNEIMSTTDTCVKVLKEWAITHPGQPITAGPILTAAGYMNNGLVSVANVKDQAIKELKSEGYVIVKKGTSYWLEIPKSQDEAALTTEEKVCDIKPKPVTTEDMKSLMDDLLVGIRGTLKGTETIVDDKDYNFAVRNKMLSEKNITMILDTIKSLYLMANNDGKQIEATILLREVN